MISGARDVFVVSFDCFRRGGQDRSREPAILAKSVGQRDPAQGPAAIAVDPPRMPGEVATDDELDGDRLAREGHRHVRVRHREYVVWDDVVRGAEEVGGELVQHLPFERDRPGQDVIEGRNSVRRDEDQSPIPGPVGVTHLTSISRAEGAELRLDEAVIELGTEDRVERIGGVERHRRSGWSAGLQDTAEPGYDASGELLVRTMSSGWMDSETRSSVIDAMRWSSRFVARCPTSCIF